MMMLMMQEMLEMLSSRSAKVAMIMLMMQEVLEMLSSRSAKSCDADADDAGGAGDAEQ